MYLHGTTSVMLKDACERSQPALTDLGADESSNDVSLSLDRLEVLLLGIEISAFRN